MTLWFVLALMTAAAVFAVLWPLARSRAALRSGSDVAVYRDQLDEIRRDRASGRIGENEAQAAEVEVSRRLIAAADAEAALPMGASAAVLTRRRRAVTLVALIALPLGALAVYLVLGSPSLPGQPLAARMTAEDSSLANLVARVESRLASNPKEGRGWELIAPIYLRLGRYDDAVKARRNSLHLNGETADRWADLGEALVGAASGVVTAEAKKAFDAAVGLEVAHIKARFYLGLAAEQDGRVDLAATIWKKMLADAPPDAPWAEPLRKELARLTGEPAKGPTEEQMAAAGDLAPDQKMAMIQGMVAQLAERLARDGSDLDGWLRLMRSYMVLGERDKARAAAGDARRALAGEPDKLRQIDEMAKRLGLEG
jgi:cytochrome c-type biogenesis protein CcmH